MLRIVDTFDLVNETIEIEYIQETSYITEKDIADAIKRVSELKEKLANSNTVHL